MGDFNNSGVFTCEDIDSLIATIAAGTNDLAFDIDGDQVVDLADRDAWLAAAGAFNLGPGLTYLLGDATLDGVVDGQDFIIWNTNKFTWAGSSLLSSPSGRDLAVDKVHRGAWAGDKRGDRSAPLSATPAPRRDPRQSLWTCETHPGQASPALPGQRGYNALFENSSG